jgi:hypothetical protein
MSTITPCRLSALKPSCSLPEELQILRPKSIFKNCREIYQSVARFLLCSGRLEPHLKVLFSAIFHGVSPGNFHQGSWSNIASVEGNNEIWSAKGPIGASRRAVRCRDGSRHREHYKIVIQMTHKCCRDSRDSSDNFDTIKRRVLVFHLI